MNYLLDTNILLHYIRKDKVAQHIEVTWQPFSPPNQAIVSLVSFGEIKSIALQSNWGDQKLKLLDQLLKTVLRADLTLDIVDKYAEIDTFSQSKYLPHKLKTTPRNMGKNDLWIAATASVLNIRLLTTDSDFDHLAGLYLDLQKVDLI